jgi:hypothetical protein
MILAAEINKYTTLDRYEIAKVLARSGYSGLRFESANFLGITNGGDFCYKITYFDESGTGDEETGKVYIRKNATGDMIAEF